MGYAQLKVAITGTAYVKNDKEARKLLFDVDQIGFYCQDWYDFGVLGSYDMRELYSPLGIWAHQGIYIPGKNPIPMIQVGHYGTSGNIKANSNYEVNLKSRNIVKMITNRDFNKWRDAKGNTSGADFLIFSDVEWCDVPKDALNTVNLGEIDYDSDRCITSVPLG